MWNEKKSCSLLFVWFAVDNLPIHDFSSKLRQFEQRNWSKMCIIMIFKHWVISLILTSSLSCFYLFSTYTFLSKHFISICYLYTNHHIYIYHIPVWVIPSIIFPPSPFLFLKWLQQVSRLHIHTCIESTSTTFTSFTHHLLKDFLATNYLKNK
jgi:hypothetical protein